MLFVIAALVLFGALVVVNLVLTLGIVRRLREHADLIGRALSGEATADPDAGYFIMRAGSPLPAFSATTVDGAVAPNTGPLLIGFFSSTCSACVQRLPGFIEYAKAFDGRVLGVAVGMPEDVRGIIEDLRPVADVVTELEEGPLAKALKVEGLPAMATVDADGIVTASGYRLEALSSHAAV